MKKTMGQMIYETMEEKKVDQVNLCAGICSTSALSRYLNNERHMSRILTTALLQRLGKSLDRFVTLLTDEEYAYYEWKQRVCLAQMENDWASLNRLLTEKEARDQTGSDPLREQYFFMLSGIVQEKYFEDRQKSLQFLTHAVLLTMPDFSGGLKKDQLLCVQEIKILLLWQRLQGDKALSLELLRQLMIYIDSHFEGEAEKSKLYPQVAALYLPMAYHKGEYTECLTVAKRAMAQMRETGYAADMETVLTYIVEAADTLGMAETVKKEKVWLQAWREVLDEICPGAGGGKDVLLQLDVWQEAELLREVVLQNRLEQGFSQEKLSEDICEPETLSRIERGKRAPRRSVYQALARKLSLSGEYYYSAIETDDFATLEQKWTVEKLAVNRRWREAEKELTALATNLDMSVNCNRQYMEKMQYVIDFHMKRIPVKNSFLILQKILGRTISNVPESPWVSSWPESFWKHPFTTEEISVMIQMADALQDAGEMSEAILLLENMMNHYKRSRIKPEFHYRTVVLILARLCAFYGMAGNCEKEKYFAEEGLRICMASSSLNNLSVLLNNKADALEHFGKKEASLQYYRLAFYVAEILQIRSGEASKRFYEELLGHEVVWY